MLSVQRDPSRVFADYAITSATYIVFKGDDGKAYVKNGKTGAIEYSTIDDADAIQYAIDNSPQYGGKIFIQQGRYYVRKTVTIDPQKVKLIEGYGAYIIYDGTDDIVVFDIAGNFTSGGALPSNPLAQQLKDKEFMPTIKGLQFIATNKYIATAIFARNVFAPTITNVMITGFKYGIRFEGNIRQTVIAQNQLWDCRTAIYIVPNTIIHQTNIVNNMIFGGAGSNGIYADNPSELADLNIMDNSIEAENCNSFIVIDNSQSGWSTSINILSNEFGEHGTTNTPIRIIGKSGGGNITNVLFGNNRAEIGSTTDWMLIKNVSNTAVIGNLFNRVGYAVVVDSYIDGITVSSNHVVNSNGVVKTQNMTAGYGSVLIQGNFGHGLLSNPIVLDFGALGVHSVMISGNRLSVTPSSQLSGYAIDVKAGSFTGLMIEGNMIRAGNSNVNGGIEVSANSYSKVMVVDNMLVAWPSGKPTYTLPTPDGTNIVAQNNI